MSDAYQELKEATDNVKLATAEFKASLPYWVLSWQMFYMTVVMFLSLTTFRLIGAVMLLVGSKWLANWFMARSPNSRGFVRGDTNRA